MQINFFPTLENRRVLLRPLTLNDKELLVSLALANKKLFNLMSSQISSERDVELFVTQAIKDRDLQKSIPFVILDKKSNSIAGSTRFGNLVAEHKRVEIGWTWIAEIYHGSGLNKAMKFLMLQHAFETMNFNRVEIKTNELNHRSRRAIESIGARFEGILRSHMINSDGTIRNTVYYSIILEEWPQVKQMLLSKYGQDW